MAESWAKNEWGLTAKGGSEMKWIMSQDKTSLVAPESGVTVAIHSFERTGSPTSHGTFYSLVAQSLGNTDGSRDVLLGTYESKKAAQDELERIFRSDNQLVIM